MAVRINRIGQHLSPAPSSSERPFAVVVDGTRTPFSKSFGELMHEDAIALGVTVVQGLLEKTALQATEVDELIFGNVVVKSGAPNIAREILLDAGLPRNIPGTTVIVQCLSGLECIAQAARLIEAGDCETVIAGGSDSLSSGEVPLPRALTLALGKYTMGGGSKKGFGGVIDLLKQAGLPNTWIPSQPGIEERSTGKSMGYHADMMASINSVSREEQDRWCLVSHQKAATAVANGKIGAEITPVHTADGKSIEADNLIRPAMTETQVQKLKPAFRSEADNGTVTAASSSALTDGASAVLVMSEAKAKSLGFPADVVIRSYAKTAVEPNPQLLLAPAVAIPKALAKAGLGVDDIDIWEIHEAFAAQVLATIKCLESPAFAQEFLGRTDGQAFMQEGAIPYEKINPNGGSIAIGHPFAATGGRLVTSLTNELRRSGQRFGLISICAAGGIGGVMVLENRSSTASSQ
jgi:acetyl-CoA acyltransferase